MGPRKVCLSHLFKHPDVLLVTSRHDTNDRLLAGQAFLNDRTVRGEEFGPMMYFAQDGLQHNDRPHSWLPIADKDEIDNFCSLFGVDREEGEHGTSMVIPLRKETSSSKSSPSDFFQTGLFQF